MRFILITASAAVIISGCAMTSEQSAAAMSNAELCFRLHDTVSISGNAERILGAEVRRRGLNCPAPVAQPAPQVRQPISCTSSTFGRSTYTDCF